MTTAITGLAVAALKPAVEAVGRSVQRKAAMRRAGLTPADIATLNALDGDALANSLDGLALAAKLPQGVSLKELTGAMSHPSITGNVNELLAAILTDANALKLDAIRRSFTLSLEARLSGNFTEIIIEELANVAFKAIEQSCVSLKQRLIDIGGPTLNDIRKVSFLTRIVSSLDTIDQHLASQERARSNSDDRFFHDWTKKYRRQVEMNHGFIQPPDFDRKLKIPIEELYVSPRLNEKGHGARRSINLADLQTLIDRTVLLGSPGGGKSTASNILMYRTARDNSGKVPFLVVLRDFANESHPEVSIVDYIEKRLRVHYQAPSPVGAVESLLRGGSALVIFDGLDELLDTSFRRDITDRVELFAQLYPLCSILVTSRLVGYDQARMDQNVFNVVEIGEFDAHAVREYVNKWFKHVDESTVEEVQGFTSSFMAESESVDDLRSNPLMLALMCIIYRGQGSIPKNRPDIYERCSKLLFEKWDSSRQINVDLRAADYVDSALKHLALWMMIENTESEGVTETKLIDETVEFLTDKFESVMDARRASEEFVIFCRGRAWVFSDAGSTGDGEMLYKFTHRTFMEYFAAFQLTRTTHGPEGLARALLPHITQQEWDIVGQLAVQIIDKQTQDGAQRVLLHLLNDKRRVS